MEIRRVLKLVGCIALPLAVGGLSAYLIMDGIQEWYPTVNKPSFNPPNIIFGPVWSVLYILMGISLFLILEKEPGQRRTTALLIFTLQLTLNFWWSIFFFKFQRPEVAMVEILSLWFSILWMIATFRVLSKPAAYLQIPYLLWVAFATFLNISIWILN